MMQKTLLELIAVNQWYAKQQILSNINIEIKTNEIIAIIGKSGSGKSTLLRIIAGLNALQEGEIKFTNPNFPPSINMVFQNFALFPWLNVIENIKIGLEAQGKLTFENENQIQKFIKLMSLEGYQQAMPRELSNGMKQRVSLARGLTMNPDILILDEPFTTLDALTANNLKNDFLNLWEEGLTSLKSVIMVTHSIEEALEMADRILVLGGNPAKIIAHIPVEFPRPRNIKSDEIREKSEIIFEYMTNSNIETSANNQDKVISLGYKLPITNVADMLALVQLLNTLEYNGKANIINLASKLTLKISKIMPIVEGLILLRFAKLNEDDVILTKEGEILTTLEPLPQKELFVKQLLKFVPLSSYILRVIKERGENIIVHKARFKSHLEDYMTPSEANITLNTLINWGRFGEIFLYNDNKQIFTLPTIKEK